MPIAPNLSNLGRPAPGSPDNEAREIIAAYNGLRVFEGDFDKAQGQLRAIASAWLLSGIGAVGYLVKAQVESSSAKSAAYAAMLQALLLLVHLGIASLWRVDQKVYQRLLHSVFAIGYWIEYKFSCVPPTRMSLYHASSDATAGLSGFYRYPIYAIMIAACVNLANAAFGLPALADALLTRTTPMLLPSASWAVTSFVFAVHLCHFLYLLLSATRWPTLKDDLPAAARNARMAPAGPDGGRSALPVRECHAPADVQPLP